MKRGFKARAEQTSLRLRGELDLQATDPLPARELARHLKIAVVKHTEIPGLEADVISVLNKSGEWSGCVIECNGKNLIIHHASSSLNRQESDINHEISHILCMHPFVTLKNNGFPLPLRSFSKDAEDEAKYLGGCLQLPRETLIWAVQNGMTNEEISKHYTASLQMVNYRRKITGIDIQLNRYRSLPKRGRLVFPK